MHIEDLFKKIDHCHIPVYVFVLYFILFSSYIKGIILYLFTYIYLTLFLEVFVSIYYIKMSLISIQPALGRNEDCLY